MKFRRVPVPNQELVRAQSLEQRAGARSVARGIALTVAPTHLAQQEISPRRWPDVVAVLAPVPGSVAPSKVELTGRLLPLSL
ncbi:MAG: hypothetical protein ABI560_04910, partial [Myxococcales bacterium]